MGLNHIFLFIAVVSPLTVLARVWRPGGSEYHGWRIAAIVVLGITAVSWFLVRDLAGFIGGGVWFLLLFLPATGLRRVTELLGQHRYRSARRLATALRLLHPTKEVRQYIEVLRRLELQHGSYERSVQAPSRSRYRPLKRAPAVLFFITINVLFFVVELGRGGIR